MSRPPVTAGEWTLAPQDDEPIAVGRAWPLSECILLSQDFVEAGRPVPSWTRSDRPTTNEGGAA